jgi:hypothetical protein
LKRFQEALGLESICGGIYMADVEKAMHSSWGSVEMARTPLSPLFCIIYRGGSHHLDQYPIQAVLTAPYLISTLQAVISPKRVV